MIREIVTIVEIDVEYCNNTFGSSPCTASLSASCPRKCFNTRGTCADPVNFSAGTKTLRFAHNQAGLPKGVTIFPALQSVSSRAGKVNLSGLDKYTGPLGQREAVTISLKDFTYSDSAFDKYQNERVTGEAQFSGEGYQPEDYGTFFGRLRARWPHWKASAVRVLRGVAGDDLADMSVENFILTEWDGPNSDGSVTLTAKDIIKLAEDDNALCPAPTEGTLEEDISESATSFTLSPEGIGDTSYPESGRLCIGSEVMLCTRTGDDVTITARGLDGTAADSHSAGDTVQRCFHVEDTPINEVIYTLLVDYAGIDASFIDVSEWESENHWLAGFNLTATITDPEAVSDLLAEIAQLGILIWWSASEQKIKYRPNRPIEYGEAIHALTDNATFIEGTSATSYDDDLRLGTVIVASGIIDPTDSGDTNYRTGAIAATGEAGYSTEAYHNILTRWFGPTGNNVAGLTVAERLVTRYRKPPIIFSATVDKKDADSVKLGELVQITSRLVQGDWGGANTFYGQVRSSSPGANRIQFEAEEYDVTGRWGYWMDGSSGLPDYDTATDDEKEWGAFWFDENEADFGDGTGPYIWF